MQPPGFLGHPAHCQIDGRLLAVPELAKRRLANPSPSKNRLNDLAGTAWGRPLLSFDLYAP